MDTPRDIVAACHLLHSLPVFRGNSWDISPGSHCGNKKSSFYCPCDKDLGCDVDAATQKCPHEGVMEAPTVAGVLRGRCLSPRGLRDQH